MQAEHLRPAHLAYLARDHMSLWERYLFRACLFIHTASIRVCQSMSTTRFLANDLRNA
ncbi:MAG: hypothetical protein AVDCRST_MAG37-468 [uncultured Rubrobacteraceae bacterium]|uniref:Uncharacterized protein n=1 Tax=uncultured Rubrobacteraceae bacterium TaxID=349277 RepID=A0A6J4PY40_9ACTN|nr:MAG: hypothetical protein AVDCRST_MAG37-468 [uncultured Rubrobacteraceae bacterium]